LHGDPSLPAIDLLTDSRQVILSGEGKVFFAIRGKNHDGHSFLEIMYRNGVRIFVVEILPSGMDLFGGAAFIVASDVISALQSIASYKRRNFNIRVIGVTGSTGKTIVKEWLAEILGRSSRVLRSPKSYNSQIGVPLSVWKISGNYSTAIFEAGISMPGEMERLRDIIQPDIGVITNIGDAHSENFSNLEEKTSEKLRLFRDSSTIVFCRDHSIINSAISADPVLSCKRLTGWSVKDRNAEIYVETAIQAGGVTEISMQYSGRGYKFNIPFTDRASVENAITAASVCLSAGTDPDQVAAGMASLVSVAMRMEMKPGINNCQLIEDFYNSDPGSLAVAVESLGNGRIRDKVLILSDFEQSGRSGRELCSDVSDLIKRYDINRFIGVGPVLSSFRDFFKEGSSFYLSTDDFVNKFNASEFRNEIILLKGARKFEFEKIGRLLEHKTHQTRLEINLDAIINNLNCFRQKIGPDTRIMAMVKAFAYGNGPGEIASLLEYHRINYLGVAYADEGVELRKAGISTPVMVMNPDPDSFETMISYNLEPELYSFQTFEKFTGVAARHGLIGYPVHLKIDTGMHRLGFLPSEVKALCKRLRNNELLKVISVFSHFAASEDPAFDSFTHLQAQRLVEAAEAIKDSTGYSFMRHICNSAGVARFPGYHFEMVRPGIGIFGAEYVEGLDLLPAGRFITRISQIKVIPAGEPVGYGCNDSAGSDRIIAILPVGYADGLRRSMGNGKGFLFIRNTRVPLTGNICMDMCMADVTGTGAMEGDVAEIFGTNITVEEVARVCNTIPYEILTSVPERVKRVFTRG